MGASPFTFLEAAMPVGKISFLTLLLLAVCGFLRAEETPTYTGPKEKLHIYLLIGQSNMAGRAPFTEEEAKPIQNAWLLDDTGKWVPADNPLNRFSTIRKGLGMQKMNPGYTFTKTMLEEQEGLSIGLVVNAKGGSKIEAWKKGTRFYKDLLKRAHEAQKTGTIKGILWHQGESNNGAPGGYAEKLAQLVADLRADLGDEDLPFVAGEVKAGSAVNKEVAKLPATVKRTAVASSEGLVTMDRWHFDAKSMKALGERYAQAMLKLLGDGNAAQEEADATE